MIRRSYLCGDCNHRWTIVCNYEDATPDCPMCSKVAERDYKPVATLTAKSKAMDAVQGMMEAQGHTDFNDNMRAGDIAVKGPPPMQSAEVHRVAMEIAAAGGQPETAEHLRDQINGMFSGNGRIPSPSPAPLSVQLRRRALVG